jgi:hypothetical protein
MEIPGQVSAEIDSLAHPLGQFNVGGVELKRLAAEKPIECAPTPLVGLEERYLPVDPEPEGFGGAHQVRLIAHLDRCAQNPPDGGADRTI